MHLTCVSTFPATTFLVLNSFVFLSVSPRVKETFGSEPLSPVRKNGRFWHRCFVELCCSFSVFYGGRQNFFCFFCGEETDITHLPSHTSSPSDRTSPPHVVKRSARSGAGPSYPSGVSDREHTSELANARAQDTDNNRVHLLCHA